MAKASWGAIEALVKPVFDSGAQPERQDLVDLAFAADASDDVIDALDSLGGRPVPSLEALRDQLSNNGVLE